MFQNACKLARAFTLPIVLSRRSVGGTCSATVATCVILNSEGWFVTAAHVLAEMHRLANAEKQTLLHEDKIKTVENDFKISRDERRRRLGRLGRPKATDIARTSFWFGKDEAKMVEGYHLDPQIADIGIGRLEPFDPAWITSFPVFKDPSKDFEPGTSLCRMGFPFHRITPVWSVDKDGFELPAGSVPMPLFPNEGIFTRTAEIILAPGPGQPTQTPPFPLRMIETSTPGIPGQSGGPIFDAECRIWGIQSSTMSFPLELNTKEKQYFNVGLGIHPDTIFAFLRDKNVRFQISSD